MADISVIEFGVYGLVAYSSLLMLVISVIKEVPETRAMSLTRIVYIVPGMICAALLISAGPNIVMESENILIENSTGNLIENRTSTSEIPLQNEVWVLVHYMIFLILFLFLVIQILMFMTKTS